MSVYFMANIRIFDPVEYKKFLDHSEEVFTRYKGKYLAVDNLPEVIEGDWPYSRAVLICFDCKEDFEDWYDSDDYQEILQYRCSAANCDTILIHGN
jgi:uncharacterized protein (DUF1330 family)